MSSSHMAVGAASTAATSYITTVLTGFHHLDAAHAAAWAGLIVTTIGAVYALAAWFVSAQWPKAPPLPDMAKVDVTAHVEQQTSATTPRQFG